MNAKVEEMIYIVLYRCNDIHGGDTRILVIMIDALGDMIITIPLIREL